MAKRLFAFVLVLALVISLMPQVTLGVSAEGAKAPGASEWCDHTNHDGWTEVTKATGLPKTSGKYYLSEDIDLTAVWEASSGAEIHLCLNGHDITQTAADSRIINVSAGRKISVYDCAKAYEGETYVGGKITGGTRENGAAVWISRGSSETNPGVFNLYGGRICNNTKSDKAAGGAVYLQSGQVDSGVKKAGGVFNMYGGELVGNGTRGVSIGGAVYLHGVAAASRSGIPATFNMYDGLISGNKGKQGGAVSGIEDAVINIHGGEIRNNDVTGSGGAIYSEDAMIVTVDGGAVITGNKSVNASAIYGQNQVQLNIGDVNITGNEASATSGEGYGAAVYMTGNASKITLTGKPVVSGNTMKNAAIADLFINSSNGYEIEKLYVNEMTGGDVRFGIKDKAATITEASDVVLVEGTQSISFPTGSICYWDGTEEKTVGFDGTAFKFVTGHYHNGIQYLPWTETNKLPSKDSETNVGYYLENDVTVSKTANKSKVTTGTLHLCLNGKTVSQAVTDVTPSNSSSSDIFRVDGGALYMSDCTTVYDENGYFVSGGKITGGVKKGNGAALYINKAASVVEVTGVEFSGNVNTETSEGYGGAAVMARYNTTAARFIGCKFDNNQSKNISTGELVGGAGALALREGGTAYVEKCLFTNNKAKHGAAIFCTGSTLTVKDSKIIDNTGLNATAINILGTSNVTIDSCTITGNTNSSNDGYGAVNLGNGASNVYLTGKTVIYDNLNKDGNQQNLHLQDYKDLDYDVSGLTAGAKVGISFLNTRLESGDKFFSTTGMTSNPGYCISDHAGYEVVFNSETTRLELAEKSTEPEPSEPTEPSEPSEPTEPPVVETHTHKLCNDASCTSHGDAITFEPWGDDEDEKGKLPTSGNWYLAEDIKVSAATAITSEVNLCLNGKTVTQTASARFYTINVGGKLSITDCAAAYTGDTYTGGKLTGGKHNTGSAVYVSNGTTFNLYGGRITNCGPSTTTSAQTGAPVFLHSANMAGATFNMYGGEFTGNGGQKNWGGAVSNGGGNAGKTVYINIYGGKIFGNTAVNGGAIRVQTDAVVTIAGGEIYGNHATATGGAIYLNKSGVKLNLQGGKIYDNTAATNGGAIFVNSDAGQVTVSGAPSVQNNKVGTAQNNLHLAGNAKITVGALQTNALIGLSREETRSTDVVSTNTVDAASMAFFTNDNAENYVLGQKDGYVTLGDKPITTEHMHNMCNDTACTDHAVVPFVKWEKTDSLPESGNYYLANDVTLTAAAPVSGELNLCLNGHTIAMTTENRIFTVAKTGVLSITDCGTTGTITGGKNDFGSVAFVSEGATVNLFGGKLTGNGPKTTTAAATGAVIFLRSTDGPNATFNMYGGEITGNGGEKSWGGAVSNASGNANNKVYVNMYGGKIYGNTAMNGGAFRMENASVTTIYGGEIYDNTAAASGGAIYLTKGAELVLKGGKITGNNSELGAGIFVNSTAKVAVADGPVVTDNLANGKPNNLYLNGDVIITLGEIKEEAKLGLTVTNVGRAISTESETDYTANFTSDSAYKVISYKDKLLYIDASSDHNHCICNADTKGCDHTKQVWTAWESETTLPTSGTYYLTCDVQLSAGYYSDYAVKDELNLCLNGHTVTAYEGKRILMSAKGGTINLTDCNENPGTLTGGTAAWGAAVNINAGSTFNMFGGKISGNKSVATSGGIGAVYVQGDGSVFNMYGGEISGNESTFGAIYSPKLSTMEKGMFINMYGGTIANNKCVTTKDSSGKAVGGSGGAFYLNKGTVLTIEGGVIKNNSAEKGNGGAIFATGDGTIINMKGGEISGNIAKNGGGIITQTRSKLIMTGGKIANNKATSNGGGVYVSTKTNIEMKGGTISGNTALSGAGLYLYRSEGTFSGGSVTGNHAKSKTTVNATTGKKTTSGGTAGAMYLSGGDVVVSGTSFTYNKADVNGGAIVMGRASYTESGVKKYDNTSMNIYGGYFGNNQAVSNAGALLIQSKDTVVNMYGGTFANNYCAGNAGAVYVSTDTVFNMTGGTFTGNHSDKSGGAFYCYKSTVNITGGEIHHNTATTSAGMLNAANKPCVVTIKNIKIHGSEAKSGGALVTQSKATMYVEDCEIYDNKTLSGHGGAVFVSSKYSNGYFKNCKFYNNTSAGMGGAVYASDFSDSSYTNCEFYDNHAVKQGGGLMLYTASTSVLENCTFRNNLADDYGGGIAVRGNCVMTNVLVENNTSKGNGGGIATDVNSTTGSGIMKGLEMHNCQIKNNVAEGAGGGFYVYKGCRTELYDTQITGNKAATEGGAIWAYEDLELHNTSITGNTSGAGYAVYMADSQYDGHSYFTSRNKMSGNVIIKDNEGGNLYMGKDVVIVITADGLGQDTYIDLQLHSGTVTNRIFGAYNYEGGNLMYVVTAGDRSITDPEAYAVESETTPEETTQPTESTEPAQAEEDSTLLYAGIGGIAAVIVLAAVAVVIAKKKKAGKAESK